MLGTEKFLLGMLRLKRRPYENLSRKEIDASDDLYDLEQDCRTLSKHYSCATLFRKVDLQRQEGISYKHMSKSLQDAEDGAIVAVQRHSALDDIIRGRNQHTKEKRAAAEAAAAGDDKHDAEVQALLTNMKR